MCLAIGDNNPLFFDKEYAVKEGYKDTPASLTFPTVINFWGYPQIWEKMKDIGIDVKKLLHAKEDYEYFSPLYPGDVVKGSVIVDSMRDSTLMDMVTFKTTYTRGEEVVLIAKMTIVVMKGGEK
ncbi:MAG TPA: MaoC family dehydratase N-terminal domain-containing protein [Spirochaetota bacterium]|mgnify:CR=1 FL=1|nr:MaoC family dehydratase N-terminal domain-containing protein [Spirochaetota bacterium]